MDLTEIKSGNGQKSNRIVLKDLSKRQKELFMSGGVIASGIGLGSGLFSLYSLDEPEIIPETLSNLTRETELVGKSIEESESSQSGNLAFYSEMPIAAQVQNEASFAEAFQVARTEVGAGGWFIWKDKVYNSYLKEEWENLSPEEKTAYLATLKVEETEPDKDSIDEPTLATKADDIPSGEKSNEEPISNPVAETITSDHITPEAEAIISDNQFIYNTANPEPINIEVHNEPLEFELPEDSVIFEIPAEDIDTLESIVIDATEEYPSLDERNETIENMVPIELKNIETHDASEDVGLGKDRTSEVVEYPWGEPVIKIDHTANEIDSEEKMETSNETLTENEAINSEITEYPWGEQIGESNNISFANDIIVIDSGEMASENLNVQHSQSNMVEEYPWGEPMVKTTDLQTSHIDNPDEQDNITELNNPVLDTDTAFDF